MLPSAVAMVTKEEAAFANSAMKTPKFAKDFFLSCSMLALGMALKTDGIGYWYR